MKPIKLTRREREVVDLVRLGLTRRAIAEKLGGSGAPLSVRTVDAHLRAVAMRLPDDHLPMMRRVRRWTEEQGTGGENR